MHIVIDSTINLLAWDFYCVIHGSFNLYFDIHGKMVVFLTFICEVSLGNLLATNMGHLLP